MQDGTEPLDGETSCLRAGPTRRGAPCCWESFLQLRNFSQLQAKHSTLGSLRSQNNVPGTVSAG